MTAVTTNHDSIYGKSMTTSFSCHAAEYILLRIWPVKKIKIPILSETNLYFFYKPHITSRMGPLTVCTLRRIPVMFEK